MHFPTSLLITLIFLGAIISAAPTNLNTTDAASVDAWIPFGLCTICDNEFSACVRHCGSYEYCPGWCKLRMCTNDLDPQEICRRECGFNKNCGPSGKV